MSIGRLLSLTLLGVTLVMVVAYSWLLEANLESGLLLGAEFRLNRAADAWIDADADPATLEPAGQRSNAVHVPMPPADGTPILHSSRESLPIAVQENIPETLIDGQFTVIQINEVGLLNQGHLLHLFRTLPGGEGLHVAQRLVLAEHERERVIDFDAMADRRLGSREWFIGGVVFIVLLVGHRVTKATKALLRWCETLSIDSLPDKPPALPFVEIRRIAAGTLAAFQRERDAVDQRQRFLRFASHELRTPLAIASANTELLARHGVGANGQDALERLEQALNNMNGLTDTLLWLGRGELPLPEPEPIDLLCLVNSIVDVHAQQALRNNVVVEVVWASKAHTVQPRILLEILCSNLIGNAIRHTRDGRVEIRLTGETIEIENRGDRLGEVVADGCGHGLGLELVAWVVERANWQWEDEGGMGFRRHRVHLTHAKC